MRSVPFALVGLLTVAVAHGAQTGCARGHESTTDTSTRAPQREPGDDTKRSKKVVRVGNQVGGYEDQPDYDAEAEAVRRTVAARLPDPIPEPAVACKRMLDAVVAYYRQSEGDRSVAVSALGHTRGRDLDECKTQTSPAAASCVAVLMGDQMHEYPRALDLCSRAYRS